MRRSSKELTSSSIGEVKINKEKTKGFKNSLIGKKSMNSEIKDIVENSIQKLLEVFKEDPHIFWTEGDVKSYLYHLLLAEPFFRKHMPTHRCEIYGDRSSHSGKTILVHTETEFEGKKEDITIFEFKKKLDETKEELDSLIGIEIKFNRRNPSKGKSNIFNDLKSLKDHEQGYMIWLNWDRRIESSVLEKVKEKLKQYKNVKLIYFDLFSN